MSWARPLAALAIVTTLGVSAETRAQGARAGVVIEFTGESTVLRAGSTTPAPLSSYAVLWPGDRVETGGRAQITLANGALVMLDPSAALVIPADAGEPALILDAGDMTYIVLGEPGALHTTRTRHGTLSVEPGVPARRASFTVEIRRGPGAIDLTEVCSERAHLLATTTGGVHATVAPGACVAISQNVVSPTERRKHPAPPAVRPPPLPSDPPPADQPRRWRGDAGGRMRLPS